MRVLVIGAGQIGSRHLQGLAAIPDLHEVVVVDPSAESRKRAEDRWRDVPGHADKRLAMQEAIPVRGRFDAAIVATNAPGRLEHLGYLADIGVRHVLAEKLLFQSLAQWDVALALASEKGLAVYPNYVYRYATPWARLRERTAGASMTMSVTAGDIGLATNLPHWLDLFEFLAGSALVELRVENIGKTYPSKRGGGLLECAGALAGVAGNGSRIAVRFGEGGALPVCRIETGTRWIVLEEGDGTVKGPLAKPDWQLETPMVSRITTQAIPDILSGSTRLPDLAATAAMNRLLLQALGKAMLDDFAPGTLVPIT